MMHLSVQHKALTMSSLVLAALVNPIYAMAQTIAQGTAGATPAVTPRVESFTAPTPVTSSTIIPTDTLPLPTVQNRLSFAENLQLRILQKLPSRLYFNSTVEVSGRYESNPFQFPKKESLIRQLPPPQTFRLLNAFQQAQIYDIIGLASNDDLVFRVLPNVTVGWTLTPHTRLYGNYFMIRDQLARNVRLNTVIHSIGMGLQQDIPITSRGNIQAEIQWRELYQLHQACVFDYLPGLTASYVLTPRTVLFANALLQLRGKRPFQAPTKEIDPFYTWGMLYQRNGWSFSASTTFVQNFRHPFRRNATIPVNNYSFISDFEISRRVIKQLPGLQAFIRAEPIWNFHSGNRPGLSGMDFRFFWGLRMAMAKPALTSALEQLRQQLEEQEGEPPAPNNQKKEPAKPSAYVPGAHELIASSPQPIHGFLNDDGSELTSLDAANEKQPTALIPKAPKTTENPDNLSDASSIDGKPTALAVSSTAAGSGIVDGDEIIPVSLQQ